MNGLLINCSACGAQRWAGLGPCRECGEPSPEYKAETVRINRERALAGLPPLLPEAEPFLPPLPPP